MGMRVQFHSGSRDGLEAVLIAGMSGFRAWYEEIATEPDSGFSLVVLEITDEVLAQGHKALAAEDAEAASRVDALVDAFVCDYCDWGPGRRLLPAINESMLAIRHYEACLHILEREVDERTIEWWKLMLSGRPIARDPRRLPYNRRDPVFRPSYATADEAGDLLAALQPIKPTDAAQGTAAALEWTVDSLAWAVRERTGLVVTVS